MQISFKVFLLLLVGFAVAVYLRFWRLGQVPEGLYSDEALYAYEAYSLLKTGKDQFGNITPLSIAGFGDYRPAGYIYSTIPFIAIFGLNEFAARLPSAIFNILTIFVSYLFIKEITGKKKAALLGVAILTLSPWSLYFSRMAHETNLTTLLITSGLYYLYKSRINNKFLLLAMVLMVLSTYVYHNARVFVPLCLLLTAVIYHKFLRTHKKLVISAVFLFIFLAIPLFLELRGEEGWARVHGISFWDDPGTILKINSYRGQLLKAGINPGLSRLIINKASMYPLVFGRNFIQRLQPSFILFTGDTNGVYNTPNNGILLWIEPFLIGLGLYFLIKKNRQVGFWIMGLLIIGIIPDALTRLEPSSARLHLILPLICLLSAYGMYHICRKRIISTFFIILLLSLNSIWFWYNYLVIRPVVNKSAWRPGIKEMVYKASESSSFYDKIWISRTGWGWIQILFYAQYDPATFQVEAKVSPKNELGFWWVSDLGKYHLDWLPEKLDDNRNILYIATPREFPNGTQPIYIINDREGQPRYWFVDKTSFEKRISVCERIMLV